MTQSFQCVNNHCTSASSPHGSVFFILVSLTERDFARASSQAISYETLDWDQLSQRNIILTQFSTASHARVTSEYDNKYFSSMSNAVRTCAPEPSRHSVALRASSLNSTLT